MSALPYYRKLARRVARLPLDTASIGVLRKRMRFVFQTGKVVPHAVVDRRRFDAALSTMDNILVGEKYKEFGSLLDLVYKESVPRWAREFQHTKYNEFKHIWPQVHLIEEFGRPASVARYFREYKKLQPVELFLLMHELGLQPEFEPLLPISHERPQSNLALLLEKATAFHKFVAANSSVLLLVKVLPLEVTYEPNRYGLPLSVESREHRLKTKVNYVKSLLSDFRPVPRDDLDHLIAVATERSEVGFNRNFWRYMVRKHNREEGRVSLFEKKYVRHKTLIPDARNIRFYYREYVVRQFSVVDGQYTMSPMTNFYE